MADTQAPKLERFPSVCERTGKSRSQLYIDIKEGRFPKPVPIGKRSVAFDSAAVDQWIENQIQQAAT